MGGGGVRIIEEKQINKHTAKDLVLKFLGRLEVSSSEDTFLAGIAACVNIKAAMWEELPRSKDCVGVVCARKSSAGSGWFDRTCDKLFSRITTF